MRRSRRPAGAGGPVLLRRATAALLLLAIASASGAAAGRTAPTLADLVQVTDISGLSASPDGRTIVFRTERASIDRNSYVLTWHAADLARGTVREISGGGEPLYVDPGFVQPEEAFWSPDGRFVHFRALVDGAIGIRRAAVDGSGSAAVVVRDEDVESPRPAPGGGALLYEVGPSRDEIARAERREYDEGVLVDAGVDLGQNLVRGGWVNGRMATQRLTGRWFARSGLLRQAPRRLRRLDLAGGQDAEAGPAPAARPEHSAAPGADMLARSSEGDVAEATWNERAGSLLVRRARSGESVRCAARACTDERVVALAWRPGFDQLVLTVRDRHHAQTLHLWDVGSNLVRRLAGGDGLLSGSRNSAAPCAVTREAAVCVAAGAASPPRVERIDLETGGREILHDPNARLRAGTVLRVEPTSWAVPGHGEATAMLLMPLDRSSGRLPLFVNYYRCEGFLRGGEGDEWPFAAMVEAGIAVACINALPMSGDQDAIANYRAGLAAVRALVDLLDRRGIIDRSRVGMGGFSFGSEVTMWVAMHSGLLAAASISSPQIEPGYYWFNAVRGRDQPALMRRVWGLGAPGETPERWRLLSPALNAGRLRAPLLLQLPEQEARFVAELYARLTNSATPAELHAFPDEAHFKLQPRHRLAVYRRNLDWFRYWLQGWADPDPARAEQYRRWDLLRQRRSASP